jgi:hypothetical protein
MVNEEGITDLPPPVRRSLRRSGVVGRGIPAKVLVRQKGQILLRERWFPFTANEEYSLDPPEFEWRALTRIAGLPLVRAVDSLSDGRGRMHVRVLGLLTVVDETGPEMDQGALTRWLNETMWFPQVWATDAISWTPIDDQSAVGTVSAGGLSVEGEFRFDADDRFADFRADRYRSSDSDWEMTRWATPIVEHGRFGGVEVPARGYALWLLEENDLEYIRIRITDIRYE